jgi:restriction endonuclease S subunit
MFGDVESNPLRWKSVSLSDLCDLQNGYAFKSDDYLNHSSVLNCRMSNIRPNGGFDADYHPKYLPDEYWYIYESYRLFDGDVIIAMTDMASDPKILGVPTIVKTNGYRFLLNQRVGKLVFLNKDRINSTYLMTFLGQSYIRKTLSKHAGGSTQINVGKPAILALDILEPPRQLQDAFSEFAEQVKKTKATIQKSLDETQLLFDSLMQQYFG